MFYLKKHRDEDGEEYILASDVFQTLPEWDDKAQKAYEFLLLVEPMLNYFVFHTSTAFGNPDLARMEGKVAGYCMAKGWVWDEVNGVVYIRKGKRTLFKIEKPSVPQREKDNRKELSELRSELGF